MNMRFELPLSLALLAGTVAAQRGPLPGIPLVPPPVPHPGLLNQPFFQPPKPPTTKPSAPPASKPAAMPVVDPIDPDTYGTKLAGKVLAEAVARVMRLPWNTDLAVARSSAAASGKPIFWVQALGELDGEACSTLQSLRGITFANDVVYEELRDHFVLGRSNIEREPYVGLSAGYRPDQSAVGTSNGTGGRNVQIVIMTADETVLSVLPGFWHAIDLLSELKLAGKLNELQSSSAHSAEQKAAMFAVMHRAFARSLSSGTIRRSLWPDPDRLAENVRAAAGPRDTVMIDAKGKPLLDAAKVVQLKPVVQVVHERLAAQPFAKRAAFDFEALVDYGVPLHDDNAGTERGRPFVGAVLMNQKREKEARLAKAPEKPADKPAK